MEYKYCKVATRYFLSNNSQIFAGDGTRENLASYDLLDMLRIDLSFEDPELAIIFAPRSPVYVLKNGMIRYG